MGAFDRGTDEQVIGGQTTRLNQEGVLDQGHIEMLNQDYV